MSRVLLPKKSVMPTILTILLQLTTKYKHWWETFLNYLKVGLFYWKWHQESRFADTKSSIVYKHFVTPPHLQLAKIVCLRINAIALPHCPEAQISNSRKQMDTDRSVDTWIPFPYASWELNRAAPFYGLPLGINGWAWGTVYCLSSW